MDASKKAGSSLLSVRMAERNPKGWQTVAGGRVCETPGDSVNSSSTLEGCQKSGRSNRNAPVWHPYGVLSLAGRSGGLADSTSGYALSTLRVERIHRMPTENSEEPIIFSSLAVCLFLFGQDAPTRRA